MRKSSATTMMVLAMCGMDFIPGKRREAKLREMSKNDVEMFNTLKRRHYDRIINSRIVWKYKVGNIVVLAGCEKSAERKVKHVKQRLGI